MRKGAALTGALAAALVWAAGAEAPVTPPFVYTAAPRYDPTAWLEGRERFPSGAALRLVSGRARRGVAPGFHAAADAQVSFDGARVLFAGKRTASEPWRIWEAALAGGAPRQITSGERDCLRPLYLPDLRVVYTRLSPRGSDLEIVPLEGGETEKLTFAPGRYLTADVLRDGRILFEAAAGAPPTRELWVIWPDGTGVSALRCDHGRDRAGARQVSSGDVIFSVGPRLARFASALAGQAAVAQPDFDSIGPVAEAGPGMWILSLRRKPGATFGLFHWVKETGRLTEIAASSGANAVQPAIVAARVPPRRFPSALVPERSTANLLCLDAGAARAVRVYTQDAAQAPVLLGQAGVERDGSFYVEVPADRPLRLELLDGAGGVVRAERNWFWMRPSEQRICVGCHAGPERAPENKVPEILLRSVLPAKMLPVAGQK